MTATGGTIHLSFSAMQAAEASLTHQLTGRLEQLAGDRQPLIHRWSDEAQAAYVGQKQRWEAAAADLATMLGAITKAPGATTADHPATGGRIAAAFG